MGPKRLGMLLVLMGPSLMAWVLRSVWCVRRVLPIMAKAGPPRSQAAEVPMIYHKGRNFPYPV